MNNITLLGIFISLFLFNACQQKPAKILVFSKTEGFRHESIPAGIKMFQELGKVNNFMVDTTEQGEFFKTENLKNYNTVVFLSTTGDVLNSAQEAEFKRYIQAGGSFLGIHAAADTEYDWPWFGELVGGYFNGHPNSPNVRDASIDKTEHEHVSTTHLPARWDRTDEWYNYKKLNPNVTPVLNLDEKSYEGGTNGAEHPIAWYHEFDGGRAYYSGGGHTDESFEEENFVKHILGALEWTFGMRKPLNYATATVLPEENRFVKEELDSYFNEPMELDLLPDGRIVFIERKGAIKLYDPNTASTKTLTEVEVYSGEEDGLIGMAIDPNFSTTGHIFLCYSHPEEIHQSISRFDFDPNVEGEGVLKNEVVVFTVPTQRDECCHSGGSIEFDHNGLLWASFGDNTNPHESDGHNPIDERKGKGPFDAQKSASNTNDLRGKIVRIKMNADGSYDIPDGNLFPKDGSAGRPEIYVMGCRNPFRFSIDSETNYVYWGEVGPDASEDGEDRGPRGYDEMNQAKGPGFFGWPYFIGDNKAYNDYDFATKKSGAAQDPAQPINDSPNNTGVRELPAAQKAMVWYPYAKSEEFPQMGSGSRNAMAGPVYHAEKYQHENRFPEYYNDKLFVYDWMRGWIMAVSFDEKGDRKSMEPFLPSTKWNNLMDIVMSPDGTFYTLEYGTGWFSANENAILSQVKYIRGNRVPQPKIEVNETAQAVPFVAKFDASGSEDYDGDELKYNWTFGDGSTGTGAQPEHTYTTAGNYIAEVKITDKAGASSTAKVKILAGNAPPKVNIALDGNQNFYFPGQPLNYKVTASDTEDGTIDGKNIALSVDYLERGYDMTSIAQGHMALSQIKTGHPGQLLIGNSDCVSCHKVDGKSIGPSYTEISKKYLAEEGGRGQKISYLADKITKGGGGVWGETAMAAHPDLPGKDVAKMAEYILSITDKKETIDIPSEGTYTLAIPKGKAPGGKFILMASYTDKGAQGVEPLRTFSNVVLRDASISAVDFSSLENGSKFKVTEDIQPGLEEPFDIVILNDGAIIKYDEIDLTGISAVVMTASSPDAFAAGGTYEVFLDNSNGAPVFKGELKPSTGLTNIENVVIPLAGQSGKHELIAIFKSNKEGAPVGTLMNWTFMPENESL